MEQYLSLYIHIPFCQTKCPYCDFYSIRSCNEEYEKYVDILIEKIKKYSKKINRKVDTIYFGGGTPSVIGSKLLCKILFEIKKAFIVTDDCEITFEVNPKSGKFFDFESTFDAGFNRVSIGMQSANENELKALGRNHNSDDVINTINLSKKAGINNISLDLMLGIPHQTISSLQNSLDFCVSMDIPHISSYILKIEENTVFHKKQETLSLPDDNLTADLYLYTVDYLNKSGINQYEISNFSKKGYESKHNLKYWQLKDYLGIGPGAHSYLDGKRFFYERSITDFENDIIIQDGLGGNKEEYIMLSMRLTKGIDLLEYEKIFGNIATKDFLKKIEKYQKYDYIDVVENKVFFTPKGMLISNSILSDLIY